MDTLPWERLSGSRDCPGEEQYSISGHTERHKGESFFCRPLFRAGCSMPGPGLLCWPGEQGWPCGAQALCAGDLPGKRAGLLQLHGSPSPEPWLAPAQGLLGRPRATFVPTAVVPCEGLGLWWPCPEPCSSLRRALPWAAGPGWARERAGSWGEGRELGRGGQELGWTGQCLAEGNSSIRERWEHAWEGSQQGLVLQSQGCTKGAQSCRGRGEEAPLGPYWPGQSRKGAQGIRPSPQTTRTCKVVMEHPGSGPAL